MAYGNLKLALHPLSLMETLDCISSQGRASALPAALDADSSVRGLACIPQRPQAAPSPGSAEPPPQSADGAAGAGKGPGVGPTGY